MASWDQGDHQGAGQENEWSGANSNDNVHAGHVETDGANGTETENQGPPGVLSAEEDAEFRRKAQEAGWTEAVPVNYNVQVSKDAQYEHYISESLVYEWSDEFGEVGPEVPQLEEQLYGGEFRVRQGEHMENLQGFDVLVEGPGRIVPVRSFADAGMHPIMQEIVTQKMGYTVPTPIQAYTIPAVLCSEGDIIAISQTGSGKTAAYLIPIISRLMGKARKLQAPRPNRLAPGYNEHSDRVKAEPLVLIVVPTHELAMQVFDECRRLCYRSMLRPFATYGGQPMHITLTELGRGVDILIGTPGRLCDLIDRPNVLSMSRVSYTVIDEADEMLHPDWESEMDKIMGGGDSNDNADHNYLMFSATFPDELRELADQYMTENHYYLAVGRAGSTHKNIKQDVIEVTGSMKMQACYDLIYSCGPARTLVFCNSKRTVDELDAYLYQRGFPSTSIHSDRSQREREDNMRSFKIGKSPIMVTTGVTARGLDVAGIEHVINYDLPSMTFGGIDEYIHRIGRTARIGHRGNATSFYDPARNEDIAQDLVNTIAECDCPIPECLAHLTPQSPEERAAELAGGQSTNGDEGTNNDAGTAVDSAWGAMGNLSLDVQGGDNSFNPDGGNSAPGW